MGVFYQLAILKGCPQQKALKCLSALPESVDKNWGFSLAKARLSEKNGSTLIECDSLTQWREFPRALSEITGCPVMLLYIYDSDYWGYYLYECGAMADAFCPYPEEAAGEGEALELFKGNPIALARCFRVAPERLKPYLTPWDDSVLDRTKAAPDDRYGYEDWQLLDFAAKLGFDLRKEKAAAMPSPPTPAPANKPQKDKPKGFWARFLDKLRRLFFSPKRKGQPPLPLPRPELPPDSITTAKNGRTETLPAMDADAFAQFLDGIFELDFERLEMTWQVQGEGFMNKKTGQMVYRKQPRSVVLFKENGQFELLCFDDVKSNVYRLIYDVETYRTVDMKDLRCRPFCGRTVKEYLIHPGKASAEQRLRALLARISDPYGELDQLMVWSWELCGSRPNTYKKLKVEEGLFV